MSDTAMSVRDYARILLAGIRLFNGLAGLFVPGLLVRRLRSEPATDPVALYALRLFGIRTILIAIDLLRSDEEARAKAIRLAPVIHASDTVAAAIASRSGRVPARAGTTIVIISTVNTILSLIMQPSRPRSQSARRGR